ncbi:hypothetical protein [Parafrankia sp. EUN1f]|uniref:hypothetical protein n=1 Tax=Parafrankia sp. EUN1f TaxID=102897 RepID=UPI0001C4714C|nr:hypothetical protein [Parafrankia sp. EUN1f]EFC79703.1 hypothetical protein FrEUN1fDRAFT_7173 [Parafrankia sp. EUN1f]
MGQPGTFKFMSAGSLNPGDRPLNRLGERPIKDPPNGNRINDPLVRVPLGAWPREDSIKNRAETGVRQSVARTIRNVIVGLGRWRRRAGDRSFLLGHKDKHHPQMISEVTRGEREEATIWPNPGESFQKGIFATTYLYVGSSEGADRHGIHAWEPGKALEAVRESMRREVLEQPIVVVVGDRPDDLESAGFLEAGAIIAVDDEVVYPGIFSTINSGAIEV